jgi:hypothetical protein
LGGQLAYQPMQGIDFNGQRGEIDVHVRESNLTRASSHPTTCR